MGSVRKQGRRPYSWQLDYPGPNGRVRSTIRVSSKAEAERVLKQREGDVARGRPLFTSADKVTFDQVPLQVQVPAERPADSRWRMLVVASTPEPPSVAEPVLMVTGTDRLV